MSDGRDYYFTIVTGMKKIGKTFRTAREIEQYIRGVPEIGRKGQKVLIFDVQNEPEWRGYKTLDYNINEKSYQKRCRELIKFNNSPIVQGRRIIPYNKNGQLMSRDQMITVMNDIKSTFHKGMVLFEDINRYVDHSNQELIVDILISTRHLQQDIVVHLQHMSAVTKRMFDNVDVFRMHKEGGNIDVSKNRIPNFQLLKLCQLKVDLEYQKGNRYYCLYVKPQENKILGITKAEFSEVVYKYYELYPAQAKKLQNITNLDTGKAKFKTPREAIDDWIEKHQHFIN